MLNVIDEFTRECLAIRVERKLKARSTSIDVLSDLFIPRGVPSHIRSDNGPEFVAKAVQDWITAVGHQDRLHRAGQPVGERLHARASTARLRDELLDGEIFLLAARRPRVVIEGWRRHLKARSKPLAKKSERCSYCFQFSILTRPLTYSGADLLHEHLPHLDFRNPLVQVEHGGSHSINALCASKLEIPRSASGQLHYIQMTEKD